jgi:hypothetical protein
MEVVSLRVVSMPYFYTRGFNNSKMVDVQTSEVGANIELVNVRPWNFVC